MIELMKGEESADDGLAMAKDLLQVAAHKRSIGDPAKKPKWQGITHLVDDHCAVFDRSKRMSVVPHGVGTLKLFIDEAMGRVVG